MILMEQQIIIFGSLKGTADYFYARIVLNSSASIFFQQEELEGWAYIELSSSSGSFTLVKGTNGGNYWTGSSGRIYTSADKIPPGETGTVLQYATVEGFSGKYTKLYSTGSVFGAIAVYAG